MTYPGTITTFTPKTGSDNAASNDINIVYTDITAIETELGTDPAGSATDVKTRLAKSLSAAGVVNFATSTEKTITSGAVTVDQNWHTIDTEGNAASDDLDTINGGADGYYLFLRANNAARTVVIRHNTGNIWTASGADISLDETRKLSFGVYDASLGKWLITGGFGTGSGTLSGTGTATQIGVYADGTTVDGSTGLTFNAGEMSIVSNNAAIWLDGDTSDFGIELNNTSGGAATNSVLRMPFGLATIVETDNVSSPPTDAEFDTAFGAPEAGFVGILDDNNAHNDVYLVWSEGTAWFYLAGTKAT